MVLLRIAGTITVVRIWIYAISAVKRVLPGWMMPWHLWKVWDMLTQIENTPDGYIVGIFLRDGTGCGRETNIDYRNIYRVLAGQRKTAGGYKWEYAL